MPTQAKIPTKPKGFNAINAMISVANVSDAIAFYADTLGAEPVDTLVIPDTDIAVYATLKISGTTLVLNHDETALAETGSGQVTLHHYLDNIDECFERAVNNGVHVVSPITQTWWGDLNAVVIDPFGVRWSIAQRAEHLSTDQRKKRFADLYAFARDDMDQIATPMPETEVPLESQ